MHKCLSILLLIMSMQVLAKESSWQRFNSSLLIEVTRPSGVFTCTGVAVSRKMLLTAAHCLEGEVKSIRIFTQRTYDPKLPSLAVTKFEIHPNYNSSVSRYKNDIAKITMTNDLPESISIQTIHREKNITGKLYRFGFGARNNKNIRTVITPNFRKFTPEESILELDDTFSYSGDSGGPIFVDHGGEIRLVAVHSTFSHGPEGRFSFNPVVADYLSWIFPN